MSMMSWSGRPDELLGPLNSVERRAAPAVFYCRGHRRHLHTAARVAIVGSRRASDDGLARTSEIACELVEGGVTIVSGLALGVDTVAHQTALQCGGNTIAVLGTGLDQYATAHNRELQDRIGDEHLLMSQFSEGTPIHRRNFPLRNRVMALVADATIIVEAEETSGTERQGWEAIRLGRPVLFPESFATSAPAWVGKMIEYGATVLEPETLGLVLNELPYRSERCRSSESLVF